MISATARPPQVIFDRKTAFSHCAVKYTYYHDISEVCKTCKHSIAYPGRLALTKITVGGLQMMMEAHDTPFCLERWGTEKTGGTGFCQE